VDVPVLVAALLARPLVLFELDFEAAVLLLVVLVVGASLRSDGASILVLSMLILLGCVWKIAERVMSTLGNRQIRKHTTVLYFEFQSLLTVGSHAQGSYLPVSSSFMHSSVSSKS
jgi:hypothetical protein